MISSKSLSTKQQWRLFVLPWHSKDLVCEAIPTMAHCSEEGLSALPFPRVLPLMLPPGPQIALVNGMAGWVSKMDGDPCVVCPYHGWAFDAEGKVRDVPASTNKVCSFTPLYLCLSALTLPLITLSLPFVQSIFVCTCVQHEAMAWTILPFVQAAYVINCRPSNELTAACTTLNPSRRTQAVTCHTSKQSPPLPLPLPLLLLRPRDSKHVKGNAINAVRGRQRRGG